MIWNLLTWLLAVLDESHDIDFTQEGEEDLPDMV